jgi:hypothetical protein
LLAKAAIFVPANVEAAAVPLEPTPATDGDDVESAAQ